MTSPISGRFAPGECVRVRRAFPIGHIRTPYYARGKRGVVERICGAFPNPEELAFTRDGLPARPLYRVRFSQRELWPDDDARTDNVRTDDTVDIEIFEHWLEADHE